MGADEEGTLDRLKALRREPAQRDEEKERRQMRHIWLVGICLNDESWRISNVGQSQRPVRVDCAGCDTSSARLLLQRVPHSVLPSAETAALLVWALAPRRSDHHAQSRRMDTREHPG
jgi:hypothetical protein